MLDKFLLKDSSGNKSTTVTAFVLGFIVVNLKLLASGLSFGAYEMSAFTGSVYAAAIGALGAIYVMRRATGTKESNNDSGK